MHNNKDNKMNQDFNYHRQQEETPKYNTGGQDYQATPQTYLTLGTGTKSLQQMNSPQQQLQQQMAQGMRSSNIGRSQYQQPQRVSGIAEDPFQSQGIQVKNFQRRENPSTGSGGPEDAQMQGGYRKLGTNLSPQTTISKNADEGSQKAQRIDINQQLINIKKENNHSQSPPAPQKSYQTISDLQKMYNIGGGNQPVQQQQILAVNYDGANSNPFKTLINNEIKVEPLRPTQTFVSGASKSRLDSEEKQNFENVVYPAASPKYQAQTTQGSKSVAAATATSQLKSGPESMINVKLARNYQHLGTQKIGDRKKELPLQSIDGSVKDKRMSGNFRGTVGNDSIINSNSIDSLSEKLNNVANDNPKQNNKNRRESIVRVRFGNTEKEDSSNYNNKAAEPEQNIIMTQPIMKTGTFIKIEEEPRTNKNLRVEDAPQQLQKALTRKSTKRNAQGYNKQGTKKSLNKRNESDPIHDDELSKMENMLGGESSIRKSTIRTSHHQDKAIKLGGIKDLNISEIGKNDEDDPNQLFSLRQAIVETTPDRDSQFNSRSPEGSRTINNNNHLQVQPSLSKKPISALNQKQNNSNPQLKRVSFNQDVQTSLPSDPSQVLLTLIQESEKQAQSKKSLSPCDGKKSGFGYHSRLFTHFSINFGIQMLREAKASDQGCFSRILANSQISTVSALHQTQPASLISNAVANAMKNKFAKSISSVSGGTSKNIGQQARIMQTLKNSTTKMVDHQKAKNAAIHRLSILQTQTETLQTASSPPKSKPNILFGSVIEKANQQMGSSLKTSVNNEEEIIAQTMNSPHILKELNHNTNVSLVTLGTDNTEANINDPFPLPPIILTDRSERTLNPVIKNLLPKPPKPLSTLTPQPRLNKGPGQNQQKENKHTIISFGTIRDELSLKDVSSQVYLKIKSAPPYSIIKLPDRHIVLPGLTFSHPMTIIGSAATTIEIVNGNILIDFRDFKCSLNDPTQEELDSMKVVIQEITIIFKLSSQKMRERLDEYQAKMAQIQEDKDVVEQWSDRKLLGADLSMHASFERDNKIPYSMRGLKYVCTKNSQVMVVPMFVVETETKLEIHDCLIRSSRLDGKEGEMSKSGDDRSDWTLKDKSDSFIIGQSKRDSTSKRENYLGCDIEDICIWFNGDSMTDSSTKELAQNFNGQGIFMSCIFHNFFNVIRAGVNSTLAVQKCVVKETKSHAFYIVNPKALLFDRNSIASSAKNGVLVEWLKGSNQQEVCRNVVIQENEIRGSGKDGIAIQAYQQFSAHNLKIQVKANTVAKSNGDGILIKNLAIADLYMEENEVVKNQYNGICISQVHQKSSKFRFKIRRCTSNDNVTGYGLILYDTGIIVEECEFKGNEHGGIRMSCVPNKNEKPISEDIRHFLDKFPMVAQIRRCDCIENGRSGIQVDDFWKGPIIIEDCKLNYNQHSGLILNATDYPSDLSFFKVFKNGDSNTNGYQFNSPQGGSMPRKMNTTVSASNLSFAGGKIVPTSLFEDTQRTDRKLPAYQNPFKNRVLGAVYLSQCSMTDNKVHGVSVMNVLTDFYHCHISRNLAHAINLQEEIHHQLLNLRFKNYKDHLQGTIGGTWGVMNLKVKTSSCIPCGTLCGFGSTTAVFEKKTVENKRQSDKIDLHQRRQSRMQNRMSDNN